eukprot:CAMPEP_0206450020 /NCGR_PEP_ID=MMETSP0324_2-20121206/18458_1 /ASSEMBLY_ACC=CAM_ASM_000836 /TAXON_ID=2866 /ORGANISM="Crypthecodinium cohnii, Strain Seligo" /LENGTH=426 /DNA_ID=CAMNT_0053919553 /DNA_START=36 /DNA_END=1316 /DNA_ORIENTATION=+
MAIGCLSLDSFAPSQFLACCTSRGDKEEFCTVDVVPIHGRDRAKNQLEETDMCSTTSTDSGSSASASTASSAASSSSASEFGSSGANFEQASAPPTPSSTLGSPQNGLGNHAASDEGPRRASLFELPRWLMGTRLCQRRSRCQTKTEGTSEVASEEEPISFKTPPELPEASSDQVVHENILKAVKSARPDGRADWVGLPDVERMLVATEGNVKLATDKLIHAADWKAKCLDRWLEEDSDQEFRLVGWGKEGRAIFYQCSAHHYTEVLAAAWARSWCKVFEQSPNPKVQVDMVVDCSGYRITKPAHVGAFAKLAPGMDSYFAERIHRIYVIDFPSICAMSWKMLRSLLAAKTRDKVVFLSRKNPKEMMESLSVLSDSDGFNNMLQDLLAMNADATEETGRAASHALTNEFLASNDPAASPVAPPSSG